MFSQAELKWIFKGSKSWQKACLKGCFSPFPMSPCKWDKVLPTHSKDIFSLTIPWGPSQMPKHWWFSNLPSSRVHQQLVLMFLFVQQVLPSKGHPCPQSGLQPWCTICHLSSSSCAFQGVEAIKLPKELLWNWQRGENCSIEHTRGDSQPHTRALSSYQGLLTGSRNVNENLVKGPPSLPFPPLNTRTHTHKHTSKMIGLKRAVKVGNPCL